MTYGEFRELSRNDREEALKELTETEQTALQLSGRKYAMNLLRGETGEIDRRTIDELIELSLSLH